MVRAKLARSELQFPARWWSPTHIFRCNAQKLLVCSRGVWTAIGQCERNPRRISRVSHLAVTSRRIILGGAREEGKCVLVHCRWAWATFRGLFSAAYTIQLYMKENNAKRYVLQAMYIYRISCYLSPTMLLFFRVWDWKMARGPISAYLRQASFTVCTCLWLLYPLATDVKSTIFDRRGSCIFTKRHKTGESPVPALCPLESIFHRVRQRART